MPPFIGCYCLGEPKASMRLLTGGQGDGTDPVDLRRQGWAERSALLDHKFVTISHMMTFVASEPIHVICGYLIDMQRKRSI